MLHLLRHGPEAASVTKHVFDATGSVVSTALGFRLYRRPEVKASQQGEVQEDKAVQGMALLDLPANASSRIQEVELPGQTREDGAAENGSLRDGKDTAAAQSASDGNSYTPTGSRQLSDLGGDS